MLALNIFTNIINKDPYYMNANYSIWRLIKINRRYKSLLSFSYYLIKIAHNAEVTYEDWLKCYVLYSKALFLDGKLDDALELLRSLLDIFANIPLDEIKYLTEINKNNKISLKNNFFNFDSALAFYSKYHVYSKCEGLFKSSFKSRDNKISRDFNIIGASRKNTYEQNNDKCAKSLNQDDLNYDISDDIYSENYSKYFNDESSYVKPFNLGKSPGKIVNLTDNNSYIDVSNNGTIIFLKVQYQVKYI